MAGSFVLCISRGLEAASHQTIPPSPEVSLSPERAGEEPRVPLGGRAKSHLGPEQGLGVGGSGPSRLSVQWETVPPPSWHTHPVSCSIALSLMTNEG